MKRIHATFVTDDEQADRLLDMLTEMMRNPEGWTPTVRLDLSEPGPSYDGFKQPVPKKPLGRKGAVASVRVDTVGVEEWY